MHDTLLKIRQLFEKYGEIFLISMPGEQKIPQGGGKRV